ncbi:hypothetical protein C8R44DRAFT_881764 [Mycena epipterygia]|nr:hypothetical protein C8R44DRAFT_881764 [Mycena epipterygia]
MLGYFRHGGMKAVDLAAAQNKRLPSLPQKKMEEESINSPERDRIVRLREEAELMAHDKQRVERRMAELSTDCDRLIVQRGRWAIDLGMHAQGSAQHRRARRRIEALDEVIRRICTMLAFHSPGTDTFLCE